MNKRSVYIPLLLALIAFPFIATAMGSPYAVHVAALVGIYSILCVGLNFTIGYTGLLDLGFMAFYAIGAYTAAVLSVRGVSFWLIVPISMFVGGLVRYLLGAPLLRLRGDYLAIVTLAFGEIVRIVANNFDALTNGPKGLPRVGERISGIYLFSVPLQSTTAIYYLILFFLVIAVIASYHLENSRIGRALVAVREDELAAELNGINVAQVKSVAFTISGMLGALAGAIYAHWIGFISPEMFTFWESVFLVAMIVIGGMGNISGVLLGTLLLVGAPELLRSTLGTRFIDYRMLVFGIVMIAAIIFRPQGLLPSRRRDMELHTESGD